LDNRTKNRIIKALRTISLSWGPRASAKRKCKVDKGLHKCSKCGTLCYDGKSQKNYQLFVEKYSADNVIFEKIHMDHIDAVVGMDGWKDWNTYVERLFCSEDNFRGLCSACHGTKSKTEMNIRAGKRRVKKK
jgi:hypothetical protein